MFVLLIALCTVAIVLYYQSRDRGRRYQWQDQTMLITGGSQGIGKEVVEICQRKGCRKIVIVDVKEPTFKLSHTMEFVKCDLGDKANIAKLRAELESKGIHPTILVNNAGIWNRGKRIGELTEAEIERVTSVNMMAPFWLIRAFLPHMLQRRHGRIVNVSSILGLGGVAKMADYCASKFGLFGMTESLRLELRADGFDDVIPTVVCPFHVDTSLFHNKVRWNHRWLMSTLSPTQVAIELVRAIETGRTEVWLPSTIAIIPFLRVLPTPLYDRVHQLLGSNDSIITNNK